MNPEPNDPSPTKAADIQASDIKIGTAVRKGGHIRFAEAAGRHFRITRDPDNRNWYEIEEIAHDSNWIFTPIAYAGSARLLSGVAERIAEVVSA